MMPPSRWPELRGHKHRPLVAALAIVLVALPSLAAGQMGILKRLRGPDSQVFRAPDGKFALEYPGKDWRVLPGGGSVIATLAQKDGQASVVIDYSRMNQVLAPGDINDLFADLEAEDLAVRQLEAKGAKPSIVNVGTRRVVVIEYSRAGLKGPEKVAQYTLPAGQDLYRLICVAPAGLYARFQPVFVGMIETFQAPAPAATAKPGN